MRLHPPKALTADSKPDAGKPIAGAVYEYFPRAILAVGRVCGFGAPRYGRGTWASLPDGHQRRTDAMHRHLLAHATGEKTDPESGQSHLTHALWNLLAMVEWEARQAQAQAGKPGANQAKTPCKKPK